MATSLRNVAYALLSGADGWMFDGEDALGQVSTMSLDNQRNLKLAIDQAPVFLEVAEQVAAEMNEWAEGFLGRHDHRRLAQAARLHHQDLPRPRPAPRRPARPPRRRRAASRPRSSTPRSTSSTTTLRLRRSGASLVLYLPKIQTAEEAALWNDILTALEAHLGLPVGTIKVYVLVEQVEACFQLMEIRAALGRHFVGFNTGRWDYINSVSDAMAWDPGFVNPNIDAITMTYGYMRNYEDRVRRAVNTPDRNGRYALWQGGMEPNIPVGSAAGVAAGMARAIAGAEREQREGASGKWVAHWKMVHIVRPVWEKVGDANQLGRPFPRLTYTPADADGLLLLEPAPRTVRGARDLLSVALQYGNAFGQGLQAAALKPADFFGNDDVLYLMEDMATGEIRLSILWEWLHKGATLTADDPAVGVKAGRHVHGGAVPPAAGRGVRQAAGGGQPRRPRQLEDHDPADLARDRRHLRDGRGEDAVVRRSAEHQPEQHGSGGGPPPDPAAGGRVTRRTARGSPRTSTSTRREAVYRSPVFGLQSCQCANCSSAWALAAVPQLRDWRPKTED